MIREQVHLLILFFVISALLIVPGIILGITIDPLFFMLAFYGSVLFVRWPWALIMVLRSVKRPLLSIEIDPEEGRLKINSDEYNVFDERMYFVIDSGVAKLIPYCCINLNVVSENEERIASYYLGPAKGRYSAALRNEISKALAVSSFFLKQERAMRDISEERRGSLGVVKISFPDSSVRKAFYTNGSLILGVAAAGLLASMMPESVYEDDNILSGMVSFLRVASVIIGCAGLLFSLKFYFSYRRLARTIEVRAESLTVNGEAYDKRDIRRIYTINAIEDPDWHGEGEAWLCIDDIKRRHRYYLGQVRNKNCFEPRRRLKAAIGEFFGDVDDRL